VLALTHALTRARTKDIVSDLLKSPAMKRTIAHFLLAMCVAGFVRADQTTQSVQQTLKDQGFYYGNVTGDKNSETAAAIRRYQIRSGLQVTGEINPETLQSLNVSPKSNPASASQSASKPAIAQSSPLPLDQSTPAAQNSSPQSAPSPSEPNRQRGSASDFSGAAYAYTSPPQRINKRLLLAEVQRQLMSRGYYQGSIDGRSGRRTTLALRAFQLQSGVLPTGRLDMSTLQTLGLTDQNLAYFQPASRQHETWIPITKFKHGKWKVKWKKVHRDQNNEYDAGNQDEYGDTGWHGEYNNE
jgi:peptidoglycan hydrolase-like protein with peptidoglycan-binding domain